MTLTSFDKSLHCESAYNMITPTTICNTFWEFTSPDMILKLCVPQVESKVHFLHGCQNSSVDSPCAWPSFHQLVKRSFGRVVRDSIVGYLKDRLNCSLDLTTLCPELFFLLGLQVERISRKVHDWTGLPLRRTQSGSIVTFFIFKPRRLFKMALVGLIYHFLCTGQLCWR